MKRSAPFAVLAFALLTAVSAYSQQTANTPVNSIHVQGNVYMLVGAGGNIAVQANKDGVLLVDTGLAQMTEQVLAAVKEISKPITNKPLRFILNTHFHADHTGGNEKVRASGTTITGGNVAGNISDATEGAAIYAHENVMKRMSAPSGSQAPTPSGGWPTDTYFGDSQELFFNGEAIQMFHPKSAHTDTDSIIFFRRSDVVLTGDIFTHDKLSHHRPSKRRQPQRHHRRAQSHSGSHHSGRKAGRRHDGDSRSRTSLR